MERKFLHIDFIIMYILVLLYIISKPLLNNNDPFLFELRYPSEIIFLINIFLIIIYGLLKNILCIILFIKKYKKDEIKINKEKILLPIIITIYLIFTLINIIYMNKWYEYVLYGNFNFWIIFCIIITCGTILWEYYWIFIHNKKNISKEYIYFYTGLHLYFIHIFFNG